MQTILQSIYYTLGIIVLCTTIYKTFKKPSMPKSTQARLPAPQQPLQTKAQEVSSQGVFSWVAGVGVALATFMLLMSLSSLTAWPINTEMYYLFGAISILCIGVAFGFAKGKPTGTLFWTTFATAAFATALLYVILTLNTQLAHSTGLSTSLYVHCIELALFTGALAGALGGKGLGAGGSQSDPLYLQLFPSLRAFSWAAWTVGPLTGVILFFVIATGYSGPLPYSDLYVPLRIIIVSSSIIGFGAGIVFGILIGRARRTGSTHVALPGSQQQAPRTFSPRVFATATIAIVLFYIMLLLVFLINGGRIEDWSPLELPLETIIVLVVGGIVGIFVERKGARELPSVREPSEEPQRSV